LCCQGVELIMEAIEKAGYAGKCKVGMDVAASEFLVPGQDCYDLGTWYPEAEKTDALKMTGKILLTVDYMYKNVYIHNELC